MTTSPQSMIDGPDSAWKQAVAEVSKIPISQLGDLWQEVSTRAEAIRRATAAPVVVGEDSEGYAASLEQMSDFTYDLHGETLPYDCRECLIGAAKAIRSMTAALAGD